MCQDVGPKRVISASQPGLSFSARLSEPAAAAVLASVSVQIGLPVLRAIPQSPIMSSAERTGAAPAVMSLVEGKTLGQVLSTSILLPPGAVSARKLRRQVLS